MPALAAALALPACRGEAPAARPSVVMTADSSAGDSLSVQLLAPAAARIGEAIPLTIRIANTADRPVTVSLMGRVIAFDLEVRDASGRLVWRRLEGQTVPAILQIRTLPPGGALELRDTWSAAERGSFRLAGIVPTDAPHPLRTPNVVITIEE